MKIQCKALSRAFLVLGFMLTVGCGPVNEENLGGQTSRVVPHKEGTPDFKTYAEASTYQTQQAAKNRPAGKAKATPKPAAKGEPQAPSEPSKSP
jgi:hypothetical protein